MQLATVQFHTIHDIVCIETHVNSMHNWVKLCYTIVLRMPINTRAQVHLQMNTHVRSCICTHSPACTLALVHMSGHYEHMHSCVKCTLFQSGMVWISLQSHRIGWCAVYALHRICDVHDNAAHIHTCTWQSQIHSNKCMQACTPKIYKWTHTCAHAYVPIRLHALLHLYICADMQLWTCALMRMHMY
jgi:hypothetical protein